MLNDIPFDGEPADSHALVKFYAEWLARADTPKLFVNADEGHGLAGAAREHARTFRNQTEVTVHARHYLQEDAPDEIGAALAAFVRGLDGQSRSEEHTSELQSLMRISYAVFCLKKK